MNKITRYNFKLAALAFFVFLSFGIQAEPAVSKDSIDLKSLLHEMIENNPGVLRASQSLAEADEQIRIIRTALNPRVGASASYTRVGPTSKFDLSGVGEMEISPADNYDVNVAYNQTLYDFGKTSKTIAVEDERKKLLNASIEELRQDLSIQLINTYFQVVFLQNALKINEDEMSNLQEHLNTIQKKLEAGTATKYALLSTEVRVSKLKSKRVDLQSMRNKELAVMTSLVGRDFDPDVEFPAVLPELEVTPELDPALEQAYQNRNSLKVAKEQESLSELQLEVIKARLNPSISAMASVGAKNGFEPDIDEFRSNFAVGVGVHIPIYSASENKHQQLLEQARLTEYRYASESERRSVTEEVVKSIENLRAADLKIEQEEMQVRQADEAYKLAQVSYDSGAITNLDLLDANTNLQDSKLELLRTRIDYLLAGYEVKRASGENLYE